MIDEQGAALGRVLRLVLERIPWGDWPDEDRNVMETALSETGCGAFEDRKARDLARHLFGPSAPRFPLAEHDRPDLADRVRADLPGLVPLRAGRYLLESIAVEDEPTLSR